MAEYSVVIPAWNAERFIGQAIESILAQSIQPAAIIVVDDGSTDGTAEVACRYGERVRIVRQTNRGPGAATNAGVRLVETPLVAFIDADDLWLPAKIHCQMAEFDRLSELACVFGHMRPMRDGQPDDIAAGVEMWGRSTLLARTGSFRRVGDVRDMPAHHGDMVDWIARARHLRVRIKMLDVVVAIRRVHEASLTYRRGGERGYLIAAKAALDRRRAGALPPASSAAVSPD